MKRPKRNTKQRDALKEAFAEAHRPLSPQEARAIVSEKVPGVGIATMYRSIKEFLDEGWLVPVSLPGESPRYELGGKGHHHHFRCRRCNKVFELEGCVSGVQKLLPSGFRMENHEITLYGTCDHCNR